jgi:2-phosphoglycerate kinase
MNKTIILLAGFTSSKDGCFHGSIGAGKTTIANALSQYGFEKFSFADKLREILRVMYPNFNWNDKKHYNETWLNGWSAREIAEKVGDCLTDMDPNYFCHELARSILRSRSQRIVIDDIRTVPEWEFIKNFAVTQQEELHCFTLCREVETVRVSIIEMKAFALASFFQKVNNNGSIEDSIQTILETIKSK